MPTNPYKGGGELLLAGLLVSTRKRKDPFPVEMSLGVPVGNEGLWQSMGLFCFYLLYMNTPPANSAQTNQESLYLCMSQASWPQQKIFTITSTLEAVFVSCCHFFHSIANVTSYSFYIPHVYDTLDCLLSCYIYHKLTNMHLFSLKHYLCYSHSSIWRVNTKLHVYTHIYTYIHTHIHYTGHKI